MPNSSEVTPRATVFSDKSMPADRLEDPDSPSNPNSPSGHKWLIIIGFSLLLGVNQFLWLTFATVVISTQAHFGVNEFFANLLTLMFPIVFVLLAIHSGKVLDNRGYKKVVSYAAILMLLGTIIRWLGASSYWVVFIGQLFIAIAQPYITNVIR